MFLVQSSWSADFVLGALQRIQQSDAVDAWLWIDDRHMDSKRTFSFLVVLFNLTQTGESDVPLLTVGAD